MKSIFKQFSSENLKKNLKNIFERFPIPLILILLIAGLFFIELHYHNDISDFYDNKIIIAILSLIMTSFLSIVTYLSSENSNSTKIQRNLFQFIVILS
jgi:membrane-bound acyltransferase YfiQ involved in biofilm formation